MKSLKMGGIVMIGKIIEPLKAFGLLSCLALGAGNVQGATTITFNELAHGQILTPGQYQSLGVEISVNQNYSPDRLVAFDSTLTSTYEPDLQDPWSYYGQTGNLPANTNLGKLLIIQENGSYTWKETIDGGTKVKRPNAENSGGSFLFNFDELICDFGFDIIDIDCDELYSKLIFKEVDSNGAVVNGNEKSYTFSQIAAMQTDINFANGKTANRIDPFSKSIVGFAFNFVEIKLKGSGAIDNIYFDTCPVPSGQTASLPEPASLALWAIGGVGLIACKRRRSSQSGLSV